jgi:transcriptional regulator with XRE-family HTH domain
MKGDNMNEQKKAFLKSLISVKNLAGRVGMNADYLSSILNNQKQPSILLARLLTHEANKLVQQPYFEITDFNPKDK